MRTSVWLVRHGQTEWNKARRYLGAVGSPLTSYGARQNQALANRLHGIPLTVAIMSPCKPCRSTAATILSGRQSSPAPIEDLRWRAMHQGRWEGLTYREVLARFPSEAEARFADALHGRAEGGDSQHDVAGRVAEAWSALQREYRGERILIVTHALPIQLVLCAVSGMDITAHWRWRIDLGSVTGIGIYAGGPIVRMVNEVPRLD